MKKWKKIGEKIFFPHNFLAFLFAIAGAVSLIYVLVDSTDEPIFDYTAYMLSAYALIIWCLRIPKFWDFYQRLKIENKYIAKYMSEAGLRVKISLYASFVINLLYVLLQLILGCINCSVWFYALAGYYLLLVVMRFFLLKESRRERLGEDFRRELAIYRICGILLLIMNSVLVVVITYIVNQNRGFRYHYIVTIAMAAHTFTIFTIAIVNMVRYRKYKSPVMSASKALNFVASLVSMLSLETAMIAAFGEGEDGFRQMITAASGALVSIIVLVLAFYMIIKATKELQKFRI